MSEKNYDSEAHITKFIAPSGNLHDSVGFITKNEQLILSVGLAVSYELKKLHDLGETITPRDVTTSIISSFQQLNHRYLNTSASVDGKRSKQLTAGLKAKSGSTPEEEPKQGRLSRWFKGKKDNVTKEPE